jgi:hypothetical protein
MSPQSQFSHSTHSQMGRFAPGSGAAVSIPDLAHHANIECATTRADNHCAHKPTPAWHSAFWSGE